MHLLSLLALAAPQADPIEPTPLPPNFLVIVADDVGIDRVSCYLPDLQGPIPQTPLPDTPTIDGLAAEGIRFRNAWSNPICSPTRSLLQTGTYSLRTEVGWFIPFVSNFSLDVGEHTTIAHALPSNYTKGAVGKWHLTPRDAASESHPIDAGYDYFAGSLNNLGGTGSPCAGSMGYQNWQKVTSDASGTSLNCTQKYATEDTTDEAIQFIQGAGNTPWFLYVAYNAPHKPFHEPQDPATHSFDLSGNPSDPLLMKAMTTTMDYHIDELLSSIAPAVRARTTIVFIGDNGTAGPAAEYFPLDRSKGSVYEGGVRVPFIVVSPDTPAQYRGTECDELVSAVDLYATIAELAEVSVPSRDSVSFKPHLLNPTPPSTDPPVRDHTYAEAFNPNGPAPFDGWQRAVRGQRYKYVRRNSELLDYIEEFYDLDVDLLEQNNLYDGDGFDDDAHLEEFLRLKRIMDCEIPAWDEPEQGRWLEPFDHGGSFVAGGASDPPDGYNAVHLSLIPKGFHQGNLLTWDVNYGVTPPAGSWDQRWSIVDVSDPNTPRFANYVLDMPGDDGDLFCAGHTWTAEGNLFVSGGTKDYPAGGGYLGGFLSYMWVPPATADVSNAWNRQPNLRRGRWYPTVKSLSPTQLLVLGGWEDPGMEPLDNTYELYNIAPDGVTTTNTNVVYAGTDTGNPPVPWYLHFYPRLTTLANGSLFLSGFTEFSQTLTHGAADPWIVNDASGYRRIYGTTLHLPNLPAFGGDDVVMTFGGMETPSFGQDAIVHRSIQYCFPTRTDDDWYELDPLFNPRWRSNAVILPDARIFAMGGDRHDYPPAGDHVDEDPVFNGLLMTITPDGNGDPVLERELVSCHAGERTYHSTALLLPDARVLVAGGDTRSADYQIYEPPYLTNGTQRPLIVSAPTQMNYGTTVAVDHGPLPVGANIAKAVLIRSGSITHHTDSDQRYHEMAVSSAGLTQINFTLPTNSNALPAGYYMLFLLSDQGTPSEAAWVQVL